MTTSERWARLSVALAVCSAGLTGMWFIGGPLIADMTSTVVEAQGLLLGVLSLLTVFSLSAWAWWSAIVACVGGLTCAVVALLTARLRASRLVVVGMVANAGLVCFWVVRFW